MRTYETSFICDGREVVGSDCLLMVAGPTMNHRADEKLPEGWLCVLLKGGHRKEMCPACALVWREREHQARRTLSAAAVETYRQRCAGFDWFYNFTDDHAEWSVKDAEYCCLRTMAKEHPQLREVFIEASRARQEAKR